MGKRTPSRSINDDSENNSSESEVENRFKKK